MLQLSQTALSDQLQIGHASHPGRSGKNNEDYYGVFSVATSGGECVVAAVADGIGGSVGGEQASKLTIRTIADFLEDNRYLATSPGQRLDQAIRLANRAVYDKAQSEPALLGMGTTIVAVALDGDRLYVVHAGDSRAYLVRGGRAYQLTLDHSWAQEAIEAGRITPEAAKTHPNRHVIRRYLGINEEVETDPRAVDPGQGAATGGRAATVISPILTQMGDAIVLCTDGLTDEVGDDEIAKLVSRHSPEEAARRLVDAANAAGGADNITVVVLQRGKGGGVAGAGGRSRLAALGLAAMAVLLVGALGWLLASGTLFGGQAKGAVNGEVAARVTAATVGISTATALPDTPAPSDVPTDAPTDIPPTATATLPPVETTEPTQQAAAGGTAASAAGSEPVTGTATTTAALAVSTTEVITDGIGAPVQAAAQQAIQTDSATPISTSTPAVRTDLGNSSTATEESPVPENGTPIVEATLDRESVPTATPVAAVTKEPAANRGTNVAPTSTPVRRETATFTVTPTVVRSTPVPVPAAGVRQPPIAQAANPDGQATIVLPTSPPPMEGGPNRLLSAQPEAGSQFGGNETVVFRWTPDVPLETGQRYELVFWSPQATWLESRSPGEATEATELAVSPDKAGLNGSYRWGVLLVRLKPEYKRLRLLAPDSSISFSGNSGSGSHDKNNGNTGSGGSGGNAPTKPGD